MELERCMVSAVRSLWRYQASLFGLCLNAIQTAGWRVSIVGDCLFSAIQFYVYETAKTFLRAHGQNHQ
eukprot:14817701-Alexandrium_andersonii.AAC.1